MTTGDEKKMNGKVAWFKSKVGYGFIIGEDGNDYFVHYKNISGDGYRDLREAQPVRFKPEKNFKGLTALEVEAV